MLHSQLYAASKLHGTDKSTSGHDFDGVDYLHHYEKHLDPFVQRPSFRLLEIGILQGASLRMWQDVFPNAEVIGLDIRATWPNRNTGNAKVVIGDQADPVILQSIGPLDVVIDDGSHFWAKSKKTFEYLWPQLNPTGLYVIEDTGTFYPGWKASVEYSRVVNPDTPDNDRKDFNAWMVELIEAQEKRRMKLKGFHKYFGMLVLEKL